MKVFRGKENQTPYTGARKAPALVSYMTKQAMPAVSLLESAATLEEFKTADKVVLVGYFGADDKSSNATFTEVAEELRDSFLFGATSDADLAKAEGVKQPSIVLYKAFDEGKNTFEEKFTKESISDFAQKASTPLVGEVGPDTYAGYMAVRYARAKCVGLQADLIHRPDFLLHTSSQKPRRSAHLYQRLSDQLLKSIRVRSTSLRLMPRHSVNMVATLISRSVNGQHLPFKMCLRTRNSHLRPRVMPRR